jgi:hypothetical protein
MTMSTTTIVSQDWDEVVARTSETIKEPLGTTSADVVLLEPQRGFAAFSTTFRYMFREEWRENIDFAKKRQVVLFPLLLALVTTITTIGLQFLVGDSAAQSSEMDEKSFTWDQLRFALHLPLLMFSLGMGTFAFRGREAISQRDGNKNHLIAAPAIQPLPNSMAHYAFFAKELMYYAMLILTPIILGMAIGILLGQFDNSVSTPLQWSSLPWTWIAMFTTIAQGLAISFLASSLWMRGRPYTIVGPILVVAIGIMAGIGLFDIDFGLWGLAIQREQAVWMVIASLFGCAMVGLVSSVLILDDFEAKVIEHEDMFEPTYARLKFLGKSDVRLLVAKEFVDLRRSGALKKMTVSYSIPLLVLLGMAWLVDFAEAPIPINLLSYAPFLGFFGFNFYSWLTALDSPDFMNGLPLSVPQLIRAKVVVYFIATSWISFLFLVIMAWRLDEWGALPIGLIVMFANSIYIVALTAFLMGLRPNKAIFDGAIMTWFWIGTVLPLLALFLLSFTQGDTEFYQNWLSQVQEDGLDAQSVSFDSEQMRQGFWGMLTVSLGLIGASGLLWKLMDRRWGKSAFDN